MAVIAFVPVRSGSKSIPSKNIKDFCGKPLLQWVILALEAADTVDKIVVALDSEELEEKAMAAGAKKLEVYYRDADNATDTSSTESVMLEYICKTQANHDDLFMLVQATSPFTRADDFDAAVSSFLDSEKDSLISTVRSKRFFWTGEGKPYNYDYKFRPRRQDFDGMFLENGAFYINSVSNIIAHENRLSGDILVYEMPEYTGLELDEPIDWIIGEQLMKHYQPDRLTRDFPQIKMFLSDVDGVLTDAGMYYTENGDEIKKFSTYDGLAFKLMQRDGIICGIITGEDRELNRRRADKLGLDIAVHGEANKLERLRELCETYHITMHEVAYIGDDLNDLEILQAVGLPACPANARPEVKAIPGILIMNSEGGKGAVREFYELIKSEQ